MTMTTRANAPDWLRWLAVSLLGLLLAGSLLAPLMPLPDPNAIALDQRLLAPGSAGHWLGTDLLGRDILARLLHGTRTSLGAALLATMVAGLIGTTIGITAGYCGRWIDGLLMRGIDVLMAFPYLILALAIVAALGPGLRNGLLAIAIVNIPFFARTVRGVTVLLRPRPYVQAARALGRTDSAIIARHLLPNVFPTIIVTATTTLGWMLLETAGLSFLGLGAQPPLADLGSMLADGRKLMLIHPHVALLPGLVIFVVVLGLNLLGDWLNDRLDPHRGG